MNYWTGYSWYCGDGQDREPNTKKKQKICRNFLEAVCWGLVNHLKVLLFFFCFFFFLTVNKMDCSVPLKLRIRYAKIKFCILKFSTLFKVADVQFASISKRYFQSIFFLDLIIWMNSFSSYFACICNFLLYNFIMCSPWTLKCLSFSND